MRVRGKGHWARMALLSMALGGLQACGGGGGLGDQTDTSTEQYALAISPDGQTLATGGADRTVRLWNAHTGAPMRTLNAPESVQAVEYTPDGLNVVAAGVGGSIRAYGLSAGQPVWDQRVR